MPLFQFIHEGMAREFVILLPRHWKKLLLESTDRQLVSVDEEEGIELGLQPGTFRLPVVIGMGGAALGSHDFWNAKLDFAQQMADCNELALSDFDLSRTEFAAIGIFPMGLNSKEGDASGWSTYANFSNRLYGADDSGWLRPLLREIDRMMAATLTPDQRAVLESAVPGPLRVMDQDSITLVGHSSGACLAYKIAVRHRDLVSAFAAINGSGAGWSHHFEMTSTATPWWNLPGTPTPNDTARPDYTMGAAPAGEKVHAFLVNSVFDTTFVPDGGPSVQQLTDLQLDYADPGVGATPVPVIGQYEFDVAIEIVRSDVDTLLQAEVWADWNSGGFGLRPAPVTTVGMVAGVPATIDTWTSPTGQVVRRALSEGDHAWPGGDRSTLWANVIWPFLRDNPK